jgi:hypothetical protein
MSRPADRQAPGRYEIRIQGHLDEHWSAWFAGLTLIHQDDGTTILRGYVTDQAQLHGLLTKVRDLGTVLISVALLGDGGPASREQRHPLATDADAPA